jgi:hypothetical protein
MTNEVEYARLVRQADEYVNNALRLLYRARELVTERKQAEKLEETRVRARLLTQSLDDLRHGRR